MLIQESFTGDSMKLNKTSSSQPFMYHLRIFSLKTALALLYMVTSLNKASHLLAVSMQHTTRNF